MLHAGGSASSSLGHEVQHLPVCPVLQMVICISWITQYMGAEESIRQPLISKQHPVPVCMASVPGMPSVHTKSCWSSCQLRACLRHHLSLLRPKQSYWLPFPPLQKDGWEGIHPGFSESLQIQFRDGGKNSLEADEVHLLGMEEGKSQHQPPQAPPSQARMWYVKGDSGICGIPASETSEVENKELQFHQGQWFVNRLEGFAELETKFLRKKTI